MTVEIHDDGRGFDPEAMSPEAGNHGMRSMRERAKALGAQLVIDSVPGQGTRLFLDARLPGVGRA
jgi:signal transduction histidine kinase